MAKPVEATETIDSLKRKLNKSLAEIARLILNHKKRLDGLEERIAAYNTRAAHKL